MAPPWTIIVAQGGISDPLAARFEEIIAELKSPPSDESRLVVLDTQLRELKLLTATIRALRDDKEPMALMSQAFDERGEPIDNWYECRVGGWASYWHVDQEERVCVGLLACHDLDPKTDTLRRILDETRSRGAGKRGERP